MHQQYRPQHVSQCHYIYIQEAFVPHKETQVAYWNLQRYVPQLKEVDLFESVAPTQKYLKERGVYIISGGTGGETLFASTSSYSSVVQSARLLV